MAPGSSLANCQVCSSMAALCPLVAWVPSRCESSRSSLTHGPLEGSAGRLASGNKPGTVTDAPERYRGIPQRTANHVSVLLADGNDGWLCIGGESAVLFGTIVALWYCMTRAVRRRRYTTKPRVAKRTLGQRSRRDLYPERVTQVGWRGCSHFV